MRERTHDTDEDDSDGEPKTAGQCTECGKAYPVQVTERGDLRVIGTEAGDCECGNDDFDLLTEM